MEQKIADAKAAKYHDLNLVDFFYHLLHSIHPDFIRSVLEKCKESEEGEGKADENLIMMACQYAACFKQQDKIVVADEDGEKKYNIPSKQLKLLPDDLLPLHEIVILTLVPVKSLRKNKTLKIHDDDGYKKASLEDVCEIFGVDLNVAELRLKTLESFADEVIRNIFDKFEKRELNSLSFEYNKSTATHPAYFVIKTDKLYDDLVRLHRIEKIAAYGFDEEQLHTLGDSMLSDFLSHEKDLSYSRKDFRRIFNLLWAYGIRDCNLKYSTQDNTIYMSKFFKNIVGSLLDKENDK